MKNITVSVPDDVYRAARVRAAERGSSVSALVSDYLCSLSNREAERARLNARRRELISQIGYFSASENIPREELYDRKAAREAARRGRDEAHERSVR